MMEAGLHGEEERIYGDKAYGSAERQAEAEARGVEWCVSRKAVRGQELDETNQGFNQESHRIRARVEPPKAKAHRPFESRPHPRSRGASF